MEEIQVTARPALPVAAEGSGPPPRCPSPPSEPARRPAHVYLLLSCEVRRAGQVLRGRLPVAGKLGGRGVISAVRPGRLFYVTDNTSSRRFLVDTGSAFSIMPWKSKSKPSGPSLGGANGRRIPCWGQKSFTVSWDGVQCSWDFLLAGISFPIPGADFLRHHSLLVDVANLRVLPGPSLTASVVACILILSYMVIYNLNTV